MIGLSMVKKYSPLLLCLVIFYITIAGLLFLGASLNNGKISYPLDDAYIHMAIAKNFVLHGVWGFTKYDFSSTTSSPLYTFLIAAVFAVTGVVEWVPLLLNLIFSTWLIILADNILRRYNIAARERTFALLGFIYLLPLPILCLSGMEHILHIIFVLWFLDLSVSVIDGSTATSRDKIVLIVVAMLLNVTRYEGMFLIMPVCLLLLIHRKIAYAFLLGILSVIPLVIYGLISVKNGSYGLPNSLLIKGNEINLFSMSGIDALYARPLYVFSQSSWLFTLSVLVITIVIVRGFFLKRSIFEAGQMKICIYLVALVIHLEFARVGWVFRYEAYLMAMGLYIVALYWREAIFNPVQQFPALQKLIVAGCILLLAVPVTGRGISALKFGPQASHNIYEQQYQMGLFVKKYYNDKAIWANDIGAITFLSDANCIDIIGLGSVEVAKARKAKQFDRQFVETLSEKYNTAIAVVYDHEFKRYSRNWIKVAEWEIQNNKVAASEIVAFYARNAHEQQQLENHLREFSKTLPSDILQRYDNFPETP